MIVIVLCVLLPKHITIAVTMRDLFLAPTSADLFDPRNDIFEHSLPMCIRSEFDAEDEASGARGKVIVAKMDGTANEIADVSIKCVVCVRVCTRIRVSMFVCVCVRFMHVSMILRVCA